MDKILTLSKQWSIQFAFLDSLNISPREYDFKIIPTLVFSLPPEGMTTIIKPSFGFSLDWGFWGLAVFFIKSKKFL